MLKILSLAIYYVKRKTFLNDIIIASAVYFLVGVRALFVRPHTGSKLQRSMLFLYANGRLLVIADYQCENELAVIWLDHGLFYLFRNKWLSRQSVTI
jgi:hypothetical protein